MSLVSNRLQQYMVEFDRSDDMPASEIARLQVLRISWDTIEKRWFYLRPPDVDDKLAAGRPVALDRCGSALANDVRRLSLHRI